MYPITQLIVKSLSEEFQNTLSTQAIRRLVAKQFIHSNTSKAFRRADDVLSGSVKLNMAHYLSESLDIDLGTVTKSIADTLEQQKEERRLVNMRLLGPHLYVETAGTVTQLTIACFLHSNLKIIRLGKGIIERAQRKQHLIIMEIIKGHQLDNPEPFPIFGAITGYTYCPNPYSSYPFNMKGKLTGLNLGKLRDNRDRISIKGRSTAIC